MSSFNIIFLNELLHEYMNMSAPYGYFNCPLSITLFLKAIFIIALFLTII